MPHAKPSELKPGSLRWPVSGPSFRSEQWGDMEVGYTTVDEPLDCTEQYKLGGLPGGVCNCPHYGYVFKGSIRAVYPGSDWPEELAVAGEAYFFPAGHVLIYPEPAEILELNPAAALVTCMDAMQRAYDLGRFSEAPAEEATAS
ncbi:hypothetical protein ND747_00430 [Frankia sp. R82]|nr:hypothetical protein [Frankia sp. R82]MCM3882127.1 hypothetical protein [Frankia sp. R82]